MVLSLGLIISLAFTTFLCVLLFLYVRQRTLSVENKVQSLFQFVQEEVSKNQRAQQLGGQTRGPQMTVTEVQQNETATGGFVEDDNNSENDSDSDSDDDGSDSESDSDNDSVNDDELISVSSGEDDDENNHELDIKIIEQITLEENPEDLEITTFNEIKRKSSDEEDEELSDVDDNKADNDEDIDMSGKDTTVQKEEDNKDENDALTSIDLNKLSVSKLRSLVEEKNLTENPKKLKKPELIELLQG